MRHLPILALCMGALVGEFYISAATADPYCIEANPPICLQSHGAFQDQDGYRRCRAALETYLDEMDRYRACLSEAGLAADQEERRTIDAFLLKSEARDNHP